MNHPTAIPDAAVRTVLLEDWDPHGAARNPAATGTYDHYIAPLRDLIATGATEEAVMDFLHDRERETMCFPSLGKQRLRRVAARLLRLGRPG
ncbi:MAG TPA: hypothetical protein VF796_22690 [Humisphaera sp.]